MAQINPSDTNSFIETSTPGSEWLPTPSLLMGGGSRCLSELHLSWRPPWTQVHWGKNLLRYSDLHPRAVCVMDLAMSRTEGPSIAQWWQMTSSLTTEEVHRRATGDTKEHAGSPCEADTCAESKGSRGTLWDGMILRKVLRQKYLSSSRAGKEARSPRHNGGVRGSS
jgi:hypothetical protein